MLSVPETGKFCTGFLVVHTTVFARGSPIFLPIDWPLRWLFVCRNDKIDGSGLRNEDLVIGLSLVELSNVLFSFSFSV